MPNWRNTPSGQRAYTLPDGPKGVVDAQAFYYDLLTAAEKRGLQREAGVTATEFQTTLEATFPSGLVQAATRAFNHALYGNHPAHGDHVADMRAELDIAMSEPT